MMDDLQKISLILKQYAPSTEVPSFGTTFEALGMNSYQMVEFIVQIEEEFDIVFPDEDILHLNTIGDVIQRIRADRKEAAV